MRKHLSHHLIIQGIATVALVSLGVNRATAQTVVASDTAANYSGAGFTGNQDQGFGFGTWVLSTSGGGSYISGDAPPNFGIWNGAGNGSSTAIRSFNSSLSVGQTFSVGLMFVNLDTSANRNALELEDSSGNVLFSYWHQGGDGADGHYTDAGVTGGVATGFAYDFQHLDSYSLTLTSATTYTFTDVTTSQSINGTLAGTVSQVELLRANDSASAPSNGQDFKFNNLQITEVPEPTSLALVGVGAGLLFLMRRRPVV
ncbi:MAG TPA: PEP-CTERM sorting domain-containing protein [Verrucomicrobiae bacterium]|jgi:hypothetical protein|nr:PEP-CTERM sorting domain-containing protein [Verrucomicrobiae bacterium]